jgi:DNA-binding GntR family transcriptional regulator
MKEKTPVNGADQQHFRVPSTTREFIERAFASGAADRLDDADEKALERLNRDLDLRRYSVPANPLPAIRPPP